MKWYNRWLTLALTFCLTTPIATATAVNTQTVSICGGQAVIVSMEGRTGDIALANGSVVDDIKASMLVTGTVAAINGSAFRTDYNKGKTFPTDCPLIYGALTKNGEIVNGSGENNAIGFSYSGKVLIDRVKFQTTAEISNQDIVKEIVPVWGVNQFFQDPNAVMLMTPRLTLTFTLPATSRVFTIRDGRIAGITDGGTFTVESRTRLLIYNADALEQAKQNNTLPLLGDMVAFDYIHTPSRDIDTQDWNYLRTAVSGKQMLVQNGKNVTQDETYNTQELQQSGEEIGLQSYVAIMKDGQVALGTATASASMLADALIEQGAVYALGLDGGKSSMLYANSQFLILAGRKLTNALTIVPAANLPAAPINPNMPDDWAIDTVEQCKTLQLIPAVLQGKYRSTITREEFCDTLLCLFPACVNKTAIQLCSEQEKALDSVSFIDTTKESIYACAALGIVTGYPDGKFQPEKSISRQEAAVMLQRTAQVLGAPAGTEEKVFADQETIADWAKDGVTYVTSCGIMNGMGTTFSPTGTYNRQQAYQTMLNIYQHLHSDT